MLKTSDKPVLMIVDDDDLIVDSLTYLLSTDFHIEIASSRPIAVNILRQGVRPVIALVDLGLPPAPHRPDEGFALIRDILSHSPSTRIIVLSGQSDDANARHARALGATDFISKPADPDQLRNLIRRIIAFDDASSQLDDILIGRSAPLNQLRLQVRQFAQSQFPILIEGESGTGKELVASALHRLSERSARPYLALNCASIAPSLVEATLFGHGRGAFTGATNARSGYFEDASDGTLFLDEVGELPLELQPKLLRVLENGEFQRLGETQTRHSTARIVAATNRDLRKEARENRFRADLYHRLSVLSITVPPLRDLGDDRLMLLEHFQHLYARQANCSSITLSPSASACLREYSFPGNVRELRNIAIRLTAKYAGRQVERAQLEAELDIENFAEEPHPSVTVTMRSSPRSDDLIPLARNELENRADFNLDERLRQQESAYIEAAQIIAEGNLSKAARILGINRTTLYNRIDTLAREMRKKS